MRKKTNILKEAAVLSIGTLLILTSVAVMATTPQENTITTQKCEINSSPKNILPSFLQGDVLLWDNYCLTWKSSYHSQDDPPDEPKQWDSYVADDFMFDIETEVHWIFWQFSYWNCNPAGGPKDFHYDWNVTFFEDDGTGTSPGTIYVGPITIADADIDKSFPYSNSTIQSGGYWSGGATAFLPQTISFNASTKYWITLYSTGPIYPQTGRMVHNESQGGILLHEAKFKSEHWGYPVWTNFSDVDGEPLDTNYVLGGDPPFNVSISKGLGVTVTVKNNLVAGDGNLENLTVNFTATGGFVLNPTKSVVVAEFDGETTETAKYFPIGFGNIAVDAYCTSNEVGIGSIDTTGLLLLILLL